MIGLILLTVLATLIFFGVTSRFFSALGIANWVAFLIVFSIGVAALFPPLRFAGMSYSWAGFFVPLLLGMILFFALAKTGGVFRTFAAVPAVAGIVLATRITFSPSENFIPSMLIIGFLGGAAAFLICRNRMATMASVMLGLVLGDAITVLLQRFVLGTLSTLSYGQFGMFDTFVLTALVAGVMAEIAAIVKTSAQRKQYAGTRSASAFEAGEDPDVVPRLDDEEDSELFNDDID